VTTSAPSPVQLTEAAAHAILSRAERENAVGQPLRVRIKGGGCSGVTYEMTYDEPKDNDVVIAQHGARLVIDPRSVVFLKGSTLDYQVALMSQRFVWTNPNAKSSCGCGESFSI
jgi:iron-sulfur cluster assembly accessory protein